MVTAMESIERKYQNSNRIMTVTEYTKEDVFFSLIILLIIYTCSLLILKIIYDDDFDDDVN